MRRKTEPFSLPRLQGKMRKFFADRGVEEVITPLSRPFTVNDEHIDSLAVVGLPGAAWLQTSPEAAMKMLLCQHPDQPIYQLAKAFRSDPVGRWHRPEFHLLEWYRPQWRYTELIAEVIDLICYCADRKIEAVTMTYRTLFQHYLQIDPFLASTADLRASFISHGGSPPIGVAEDDRSLWEQLLLTEHIEPTLRHVDLLFVHDFPPHAASLAAINATTAQRFECYLFGVELANGYQELRFADEYRLRFQQMAERRQRSGKAKMATDQQLIAALEKQPLPECSGVALGVDRFYALLQKSDALHC